LNGNGYTANVGTPATGTQSTLGITTVTPSGSPFCAGSNISVAYTTTGTFSSSLFKVQLSDSTGVFALDTTYQYHWKWKCFTDHRNHSLPALMVLLMQ
jgi:hypothetical protein